MRRLLWAALLLTSCRPQAAAPPEPAQIAFDGAEATATAAKLAHGERLTRVLGCRGCHAPDLQGQNWDDDPKGYGVLWSSNLTRAVPTMTDAQLRDLLTKGIHPRRKELWVMPSQLFQHLAQADLDAVIAHLRTVPPAGKPTPAPKPGPLVLKEIEEGRAETAAALVAERRAILPFDAGPTYALGRYITEVTCAECHGPELKGHHDEEGSTPDLIVAAGYTRPEFEGLLTKGVLPNGRKFKNPLMGQVAKRRFSHLTVHERDALYAYLKARAEHPQ